MLSDAHDDLERVVQSINEVLYRAELGVDGWWHTVWKGPGHARLLGLPPALLDDLDFFDEVWYAALHPEDRDAYMEAWKGCGPTARSRSSTASSRATAPCGGWTTARRPGTRRTAR